LLNSFMTYPLNFGSEPRFYGTPSLIRVA